MHKHKNISLTKQASDILNTSQGDAITGNIYPMQMVTIVNEPYIDVYRNLNSSATFFTTPNDRDFFLVGLWISSQVAPTVAANLDTITFTTADGVTRTFDVTYPGGTVGAVTGNGSALQITFPFRGLKLAKNTSITLTLRGSSGSAGIMGYTQEVNKSG